MCTFKEKLLIKHELLLGNALTHNGTNGACMTTIYVTLANKLMKQIDELPYIIAKVAHDEVITIYGKQNNVFAYRIKNGEMFLPVE